MKHLATFGRFWYDFVVGDDWRLAIGVVATIAVLFVAAHHDLNWWWLLPAGVATLLTVSVTKAAKPRSP